MAIDPAAYKALLDDVQAEADDLIAVLEPLTEEQWSIDTPAKGWTIHDVVVHLAYYEEMAGISLVDPEQFEERAAKDSARGDDWVDQVSWDRRGMPAAEVLDWFRTSRPKLIATLEEVGPSVRMPWFGPPMGAASCATARLMETWAHGQDIYDALGLRHPLTDRVKHVCHLGVITRGFSYTLRGLDTPEVPIFVDLLSPGGEHWTWGEPDAVDRITGSAEGFALVVTQRRHIDDTDVVTTPGAATEWMGIAQAYAGNIGEGREPGQFAKAGSAS